ncbi:MAG: quinone-dependent dihydroorotate dehydrogenase [Alphaproteobacteria bacterium]|nr:MAG: quinone-dependent dihydroorotate dehydrogenase [Alphaproteobacteria bacterium]
MADLFSALDPCLKLVDPESAHKLTIKSLKLGLGGLLSGAAKGDDPRLAQNLFGLHFPNPVGLAAGFDKNAEVPDAMLRFGFGFVEVGTVTPRPQAGNPKPRLFRLTEDQAVINRMGFNNEGLMAVHRRLLARAGRPGIIGANIGANKDSEDRIEDYVSGLQVLIGSASYFTVNISSPNTPGLRGLQNKEELEELIARISIARDEEEPEGPQTPLLLKIAPDMDDKGLEDILEVLLASKFDGLIISNTTIGLRETLKSARRDETGGLSGAPLFKMSTEVLAKAFKLTEGKLPLIGVGGISSGADAYEKIKAGASLVQLYSALAYKGPGLVKEIKRELITCLERDGFANVAEAVGTAN